MSAKIMGRRYAERGDTAWWGGSFRLEGADGKATTAATISGVNFPVDTLPLYFKQDGIEYVSQSVVIVRPPLAEDGETAPVQLGVASRDYTPITNYEICQLLDPLTDRWPCETIGALGHGEEFFVTLRASDFEVAGDEMRSYFFVRNKHDGSGALKIMFTPVRVVCWNTCQLGEQQATTMASVLHTRQVYAETEFAINLVPRLEAARRSAMDTLGQFARVRVQPEQITRILAAAYPEKPRSMREAMLDEVEDGTTELPDEELGRVLDIAINAERARKRAMEMRLAIWEMKQKIDQQVRDPFKDTAWTLYQAVTEVESWREGGNAATLQASLFTGQRKRTMAAAYDAIVAECLV